MVPGASFYYEVGRGKGCTICHEMQSLYDQWHASSHRGIAARSATAGRSRSMFRSTGTTRTRVYSHLRGDLPEQIGFGNRFVQAMTEQCQGCHRQEYAAWQSGPHSATYARIFLDKKHNAANMLMDDCLRCHGMHFEGGIADLVTPVSRTGPWRLVPAGAGQQAVHALRDLPRDASRGPADGRRPMCQGRVPGPSQEIAPALAGVLRPPHAAVHPARGPAPARDARRDPRRSR